MYVLTWVTSVIKVKSAYLEWPHPADTHSPNSQKVERRREQVKNHFRKNKRTDVSLTKDKLISVTSQNGKVTHTDAYIGSVYFFLTIMTASDETMSNCKAKIHDEVVISICLQL
jgi:hypothetical protein